MERITAEVQQKEAANSFPCPECGAKTRVLDSRPRGNEGGIRRRRKCERYHRFTTIEIAIGEDAYARIPQLAAVQMMVAIDKELAGLEAATQRFSGLRERFGGVLKLYKKLTDES